MHQPRRLNDKIKELHELKPIVCNLQKHGKRVVFTNGCFDIMHAGHVHLLHQARGLGDALVVGMNSDASVRALKGPRRPVVPQYERAQVAAALEAVDYVVIFDEPDPLRLIKAIVPQVLVKGGDWPVETIIGRDVVEAAGGRVQSIPLTGAVSTTTIIDRIVKGLAVSEGD